MLKAVINKNIKNYNSGFTLLEMMIALIIIGLLISSATIFFTYILRVNYEKKTFNTIEKIADYISIYAQQHMRVPCPASPVKSEEPFGTERGSGIDGGKFGECNTREDASGIIPYITLGIPEEFAFDSFGNYLTYAVSLSSAEKPTVSSKRKINQWCMSEPHWAVDKDNSTLRWSGEYVALAKAAFCCGTWEPFKKNGDIIILDSKDKPLTNLSRQEKGKGGSEKEYRTVYDLPPSYLELINPNIIDIKTKDSTRIPSFPAYIIVSHGENGHGAYIKNSKERYSLVGVNEVEKENANDNHIFYTTEKLKTFNKEDKKALSLSRSNIDDIVFWQTPFQIFSRFGDSSCSYP